MALAPVVLWLGYLIPHRMRQRQQWAQSRAEDRFSGSLRVLAVAGGSGGVPGGFSRGGETGSSLVAEHRIESGVPPAALERGPATETSRSREEEGTHAVETTKTGTDDLDPRERPMPSSRLQLLERRAAAARRRLLLSAVLLVATLATAACAALTPLPWWTVAIPGGVLLIVLALGRRASRAARRSDVEWLARHRAETGRSPARTVRPGSPPAVRNSPPRVTGRAVHGSQVNTQMIPKVTPKDIERVRAAREALATDRGDPATPGRDEPVLVDDGPPASTIEPSVAEPPPALREEPVPMPPVESRPVSTATGSIERVPAPWESRSPSGKPWEPVPVPPPTYTMKQSVTHPDPAPSGTEPPSRPLGETRETASERAPGPMPVAGPLPTRPAGDDPKPKTETLGLDLNEILARRRAAGQ